MKHAGHFLLTGLGVLTGIGITVFAAPVALPAEIATWAPAALMACKWLHYALTNEAAPPPSSGAL